ncbi:MAG: hypothetical protein GF387_00370 [Candidatus Portnoybacteria bacterium]|nr:hypothetical protein [Candidatus Portnoybacteria bacterium]
MENNFEKIENQVLIKNPEKLEKTKEAIKEKGVDKIHVIADFDRTLTHAFKDGEKRPSLISVLRDGDYISQDYSDKAKKLFEKYHPIEVDNNISEEEKKEEMKRWWTEHFDLLIKSGLKKKHIRDVVDSSGVDLRGGCIEFIKKLNSLNIPLVIMSSGGLGGESIRLFLEKNKVFYNNVHIIANEYRWNKEGKAVGIKEPIIHCDNKDETAVQDFPIFDKIKERKNVLLLGDGLGDVGMIEGFDYDHLIKIGFLNDKVEDNKDIYMDNYDLVILNDSNMKYVNKIIKEIS